MKNIIHNSKHRYWMLLAGGAMLLTMLVSVLVYFPRQDAHAAPGDWTTFLGTNARTGYNASETTINATTASSLQLHWTAPAGGRVSDEPIMANGMLYWGSWDGVMHATNPSTGQDIWKTTLSTKQGSCGQQVFGVVGTPTIATVPINGTPTPVVFVGAGQDNLYALNASTGMQIWSTNLGNSPAEIIYGSPAVYNGSVYIGVSSSGDCPLMQGALYQVNVTTGAIQNTFDAVPTGCIGAGIWGSPSIDESTGMIYFGTGNADPINCKTTEPLASSIVELNASNLSLVASWQFTATGTTDADVGGTPTLFNATIGGTSHQMLGIESKDGNYYAFDRTNIKAGPLWHDSISVAGRNPELGLGSISSSSFDGTNLYVAGGNTTISGTACQGGLRSLNPATGTINWEDCLGSPALDPAISAPGLVVIGYGKTINVVASASGKSLFTYQDSAANAKFWGAAMISSGMLYMGSRDGTMLSFWTGTLPPSPTPGTPTVTPSPSPTASPTPPPSGATPVSKTWYFAEGKVGGGFTEWLTIENPDPVNDCNVNIQYLLPSGNPSVTKSYVARHASRFTTLVNNDLAIPASSTSPVTNSAIVTTTNANCNGVVAERPMYFANFSWGSGSSVSSGSDVVGFTNKIGKTYYFADVPTGANDASFLTILAPSSNTATANVTATFYVGGQSLPNPPTTTVAPGTRGTILLSNTGTVQHAAVQVTSDQPIMVERANYFDNLSAGNAGTVSGASSVIGVQNPSNDWLFAEGYVGSGFQENLVLANFNTTPTTANVMLEFTNGHTEIAQVPVKAQDQTLINVNAIIAGNQGICDTTPCQSTLSVSAEITTPSGQNIVVEREMFFHYNHNGNGRVLAATGGTDIIGQAGPASSAAFSFAEGYTNINYDEWLTLQNPTANTEFITVSLVNGDGTAFNQSVTVLPHSRSTVDIVGLVSQHLIHPNDTYLGYEVSMVISSSSGPFVAERPMYWNTGTTQGGSDVIGFVG